MEAVNFIIENWDAIFAVVFAVHAAAVLVVNLTPTPKDNEVLASIYPWIEKAAGLFSKKAKA